MAEKIAKFRFLGYKILKSMVEIKNEDHLNQKMNIEFNGKNIIDNDNHKFNLQLDSRITNEDNSIVIEIVILGLFEFDRDLTEGQKESFFDTNAPAILFPYVRAYVGTLTSLSGIKPIVLPTINISR